MVSFASRPTNRVHIEIAKSEFYKGMAAGTHHQDLIRAAMDLMLYLVIQGQGEAVVSQM
jgi:hypothetical protein